MTPRPDHDPIVILADAVNQLALIIEEIAYYTVQSGYTDVTYPRRARWQNASHEQREKIAKLLPE